ncbi:MAG: penicillin-insensitive murein endopeptidase [Pseudomonadota bacterium]
MPPMGLRAYSRLVLATGIVTGFAASAVQASTPPLPQPKPDGLSRVDAKTILNSVPARSLFKKARFAANTRPSAIGRYNRGCLAGGERLPINGPAWQAMRLSRNRNWGHPAMIALVKRLAADARAKDDWNGLLVGDIAMPRGGPMWPSHASHQIGLDADIWFTPMPNRRLTYKERERLSATFMLTKNHLSVNDRVWTDAHVRLVKRAASYNSVERILVHPAIKKALCEATPADADRSWLSKVRPVRGHNYHFHIRMKCPASSPNCRPQKPTPVVDGCGKELDDWYKRLEARLKPRPKPKRPKIARPRVKPKPRRLLTLNDLPNACQNVLAAR